MNELIRNIRTRRSIRKYKSVQVEQEKLDAILEAATYAPSGHNEQPWHFLVIQNREFIEDVDLRVRKAMAECGIARVEKLGKNVDYRVFFGSPTIVIVSGNENNHDPEGHLEPFADCCAAIQNMLLAAHSLGVGSCWVGFVRYLFRHPERLKDLHIPKGFKPYYAVSLGYPDPAFVPKCPERKKDVVDYLR
jgi:nitroreductase